MSKLERGDHWDETLPPEDRAKYDDGEPFYLSLAPIINQILPISMFLPARMS